MQKLYWIFYVKNFKELHALRGIFGPPMRLKYSSRKFIKRKVKVYNS